MDERTRFNNFFTSSQVLQITMLISSFPCLSSEKSKLLGDIAIERIAEVSAGAFTFSGTDEVNNVGVFLYTAVMLKATNTRFLSKKTRRNIVRDTSTS